MRQVGSVPELRRGAAAGRAERILRGRLPAAAGTTLAGLTHELGRAAAHLYDRVL